MKVYHTQEEVEKDIKDEVLVIKGDVKFECAISISASIQVTCGNITAWDINAGNINAGDINARDISYHAFCCVYRSIGCFSIKARREKHQEPLCLDGKLEIKQRKETSLSGKKVSVELDGKKYTAQID